jgi:GT2 family glycosyltransferase
MAPTPPGGLVMSNAPLLSLVVLSYKGFDRTTGPCLTTLAAALDDPRIEVILVDNGSDDGSAARCASLAAQQRELVYLPQSTNLGFAGGMNVGVAAARGEWVCLVNSDTLFPQGAVAALLATLRTVPASVAMVGPVTNAAGNGQRLALPDMPMSQVPAIGAEAMQRPTGVLTPTYRTDFFCVAVRRSVWQQLGGLDQVFGVGYYEDFDFSLRLRRAGHEQVIAEDVFVAHVGSATFSIMGAQHELMRGNRALMQQRHPDMRFESAREGNALALQHLIATATTRGWDDGLRRRAAWRLATLSWDEPKSPFKRWRWRRHTRAIRRALAAQGLAAAFRRA